MNMYGKFNKEEFRRIINQVRPDFYDRDSYFLVVEFSGGEATARVVESLVTTTRADPPASPAPVETKNKTRTTTKAEKV